MNRFKYWLLSFWITALHLAPSLAAGDEVRVASRDELVRAFGNAQPGTTILIAPGTYRGGIAPGKLQGRKDQPIVIAAADPADPPVIEGGGSGLHLSSPAHLELRDLIIAKANGNGINIDDGGSSQSPGHDLFLRNLTIRDVGPSGNRDGLKLSGVNDFRVDGCRIMRWGSNGSAIDMVGCQRGLVTSCTFQEGGDQANGVQAKGGSNQIVVQYCRFENAGGRAINIGGSTGLDYFRPQLGDFEAKEITVQDCEIIGGMSAIAFVGCDGALVQHNTIYRPTRWPLRILQENTDAKFVPSRKGVFQKNLVVFRTGEVRQVVNIGPGTAPETFEFTGNQWHALDAPNQTQRFLRLPAKETSGIYNHPPEFKDADQLDFSLPGRKPSDPGVRPAT
ncbi:MAG TPA: right-handed parallel beta-helix repeat-containing protein [Pirellulaceae bacterium]|nr:right-handed parallel beta-helix repeat-containing protein [Pirellulaceae bacterium]